MSTELPNAPRAFPLDDRRIYDAYIASRQSAVLAAAVRVGLFDALADGGLELEALGARLEFRERPLRAVVHALSAMGLLERSGERFVLAADAAAYLVRGRPGWLGGLIDLEVENFLDPARLLEAMRSDRPSVYSGADPWEAHDADPDRARRFTEAMHSVSERAAAALAEELDLSTAQSVLDVGGGSGVISQALAIANPHLRCTILDLPTVCADADRRARALGLDSRVRGLPGDMFAPSFPANHDVVLFSQILHDWDPPRAEQLVRKAYAALPRGGRVVIHEKLVEPHHSGPLANVLVHLDMLVWTAGQQWSFSELERMLESQGFEDIHVSSTTGYWSVVVGRKGAAP